MIPYTIGGRVYSQVPLIKKCATVFLLVLVVAAPLFLGGCGGNGSTPTFNISGTWNITWTPASSPAGTYTFTFTQSDSSLSGTTNQGQPISGSVSGLNVNFSFIWTESPSGVQNTYTFNGTEGTDATTMSGTWTNGGGASGAWSATFVHQ